MLIRCFSCGDKVIQAADNEASGVACPALVNAGNGSPDHVWLKRSKADERFAGADACFSQQALAFRNAFA
jgi:hypothetical protein